MHPNFGPSFNLHSNVETNNRQRKGLHQTSNFLDGGTIIEIITQIITQLLNDLNILEEKSVEEKILFLFRDNFITVYYSLKS